MINANIIIKEEFQKVSGVERYVSNEEVAEVIMRLRHARRNGTLTPMQQRLYDKLHLEEK